MYNNVILFWIFGFVITTPIFHMEKTNIKKQIIKNNNKLIYNIVIIIIIKYNKIKSLST